MATQPEPEFAKHSVHTDALETLGTLIDEHQGRDAIHLAVEPVVAGEQLFAGAHVGILNIDGVLTAFHANPLEKAGGPKLKHVGVVDPFLETAVEEGQRFWLVVYPRVITSLRHVWTHPDFPNLTQDLGPTEEQKAASKAWIEAYAQELSEGEQYDDDYQQTVSYDELMHHAETFCDPDSKWGGEHLVKGGLLEGVGTKPEFWKHFTILTGKTPVPGYDGGPPNFFSCSC